MADPNRKTDRAITVRAREYLRERGVQTKPISRVYLVFLLLWPAFHFGGWLLTLYPTYGIQISGALVEAVVVDMAKQDAADIFQEKPVEATVKFDPECLKNSKKKSLPICQDVTTTVMLPAAVAAETAPGGHVPITYLPGKPDYAVYGVVKGDLIDVQTMAQCVIVAVIAALVPWIARSRDKLEAYRSKNGRLLFVIWAIAAGLAALKFSFLTSHNIRWEIGIADAKRTAPSEIKELYIKDGAYYAKYLVPLDNGLAFWRVRDFFDFEIDDSQKMKVGRKFDVVYIDGAPAYNRPDWVEEIDGPKRKLWIALWAIATLEAWGLAVGGVHWARGGPKSPSLFPTRLQWSARRLNE